jgi:hypothetical protein
MFWMYLILRFGTIMVKGWAFQNILRYIKYYEYLK